MESDFHGILSGKMWGLAFPVCYGGTTSAVFKFGFGCGSVSRYSELRLASNCELNKGSSFVSAWALEEQAIGNEISVDKSQHGLLGDCESRDVVVEGSEDGGDNEVDARSGGGGNWEEESEIVDVRALASSLQFAKTADDVEEVLKDKGNLPLQVFSSMIRGFGRDKLMDSAFAVVEWLKRRKEETNGMKSDGSGGTG